MPDTVATQELLDLTMDGQVAVRSMQSPPYNLLDERDRRAVSPRWAKRQAQPADLAQVVGALARAWDVTLGDAREQVLANQQNLLPSVDG